MTEKCFDIGTFQAFLDGELTPAVTDTVARHVSVCDECAILLAEAEQESVLVFSALEQEFNTLVPTQRLWTKINDSIEREKKSFWKPIFAFLLQPPTAAFAGLLFVALVSITFLNLKRGVPTNYVAQTNVQQPDAINQTSNNRQTQIAQNTPDLPKEESVESVGYIRNKNEFRAMTSSYLKPKVVQALVSPTVRKTDVAIPARSANVLGEESYIKTIATLTETVVNYKDEVLNPSARFAFERDLAVTDDAIAKMRKEVKKNPNNEAARQILRASYQNKIDLLNSVADKTELMASLK